jgi:hypothetical protein
MQKERIEFLVGSFDSLFETNLSVIKKDSGMNMVKLAKGRTKHSQVTKADQRIWNCPRKSFNVKYSCIFLDYYYLKT